MKIFVNARFLTQPVSGVQRYGIECSRQIKKLHPDVVFLAPENILHKDIAEELAVKIIGSKTGHLWEQASLPFYLAGQKNPPLFNPANTAPLLYSNNFFTLHDLAFYHHPEWNTKAFSAWYNILVPRIALSSRHIFTVSQEMRDEIIKYYKAPPSKISVTYNGLSTEMLAAPPRNIKKEKIILSVGTFNKRKNHQNLVKAFLASSLKNEYQLVIVGDKNKVFAESGLDSASLLNANIKIYETLSTVELINLYERAEIVVSLSLYEGFGIPLLEGLYYGCKVACSDINVYRELYGNYAGFCDPGDVNAVSALLGKVAVENSIDKAELEPLFERCNYASAAQIIIDAIEKRKTN